jgi:hypothetical protein
MSGCKEAKGALLLGEENTKYGQPSRLWPGRGFDPRAAFPGTVEFREAEATEPSTGL